MRATHTWNDEQATIRVAGLERAVRVLHCTDVHVGLSDERDAEYVDSLHDPGTGHLALADLLAEAEGMDLDAIVLTGDTIDRAALLSIEHVAAAIDRCRVPVLHVCGNHDWELPGPGMPCDVRERWWPRLEPLQPGNPSHRALDVGGIQFVLIDDGTYQITPEQLAFTKDCLGRDVPTVFAFHVPLSIATLRDAAIATWGAPILIGDPDWDAESRERWGLAAEDEPETLEFIRTLATADSLVAVLTGHLHVDHADAVSPCAVQYVTGPGFLRRRRLIEFLPM